MEQLRGTEEGTEEIKGKIEVKIISILIWNPLMIT